MIVLLIAAFLATVSHGENFRSYGFFSQGWSGVFSAIQTAGIVFSFLGFRQGVELAGETKNMIIFWAGWTTNFKIVICVGIGFVLWPIFHYSSKGRAPKLDWKAGASCVLPWIIGDGVISYLSVYDGAGLIGTVPAAPHAGAGLRDHRRPPRRSWNRTGLNPQGLAAVRSGSGRCGRSPARSYKPSARSPGNCCRTGSPAASRHQMPDSGCPHTDSEPQPRRRRRCSAGR